MKTKFLRFLMLLLVGAGMSSVSAQSVIYSWESPDGTVIESGGTAVYMNGPEGVDRVNYLNETYYTICVNGKKGDMGKEASDKAGYIQIDLDEALQAGDIITITGYINKNASGKKANLYFKFENGDGVDDSYMFEDADNIHPDVGGSITTHTFTVPANADGSKNFKMSRSKADTNIFITKLEITKGEGSVTPVTIAMPTFEVDGVTYESGATVEGLKTGHRVTINVEDGMYIYTNWSGKTGGSKDSYYKADRMKGQTTYGASTSSGGQRVLYAVAGDNDDATGNSSDLAYIVFTDVVAADPAFTPAAGEVEKGTVVTLATECKEDKIYYTTDGSDPTAESTAYAEGITIDDNVTIKAIAFDKNGANGSAIVTAAYTVPAPVVVIPKPVFTPESGATLEFGGEISIAYEEGYSLYYTTDGSDPTDPTANVQLGFENPQVITADQEGTLTIKAFLSNQNGDGEVVTATYTVEGKPVVVGVPTFDPAPGAVEKGTQVHIIFGENAQSVQFTTDGSNPLTADEYTSAKIIDAVAPIIINEETTIKAVCKAKVGEKTFVSDIVEVTYTVKEPEVLPESNVTFDPEGAMPAVFDDWGDNFLIKKTDTKAGDKFTFICEAVEVEGWQWGPQVLPKSNADWSDLADALVPNEEGKAVLELTQEMADVINANGGLRIQGMGVKVLAVQFEAGPEIGPQPQGEIVDLIDRFTYTWNSQESLTHNDDKSVTYNAQGWGGMAAWMADEAGPADWSAYEKLVFEFAEPTTFNVQGFIQTATPEDIKYWGNTGITKLECPFEGKDVSQVNQVALQVSDPVTVVITKVYLVKKSEVEPVVAEVKFNPESGTEVEVGDEIAISFDGDNFQCWVTTDGSDPASSLTAQNIFPDETVKVAGEGEFVVKVMLENNKTNEQTQFSATYPIKAPVVAEVTFDPTSGTEVEVDDEIAISFDGDNFQCWVTTDGSDPASSLTAQNIFPNETVKVAGEGEFVVKVMLENNKTNEQTQFSATYPIKAPVVAEVTFDLAIGTEVEVGDEIAISFDGDNFQCWVTTDGSDPETSMTAMNLFPGETVKVAGEGEFVVKAMLENNKTGEKTFFTATYPIKAAEIAEVTIITKANGYGTFCYDKDLDFSASDAQAFVARLSGDQVILTEVQQVPAGTGILVKGDGMEVTVPVMEGAAPITAQNDFIGTLEDTEVPYGTVSILSVVDGEEGFYKFLGTTIPANKAYFNKVASGSVNARLSFVFEETDGINAIVADAIANGNAYNLNGQRVEKSYKGVVIVNGKKYFKK